MLYYSCFCSSTLYLFPLFFLATVYCREQNDKDCGKEDSDTLFYRMFAVAGVSPGPNLNLSRESVMKEWGHCANEERTLSDEMLRFFESRGFNMDGVRGDPYRLHTNNEFTLQTYSFNTSRIVMSTLFDYSKYSNSRIRTAAWALATGAPRDGPTGNIPQSSLLHFGLHR